MINRALKHTVFTTETLHEIFYIAGNHTIAIVKGKECYETLKSSCSKVFDEVNKIIETGVLKLDNEHEVLIDMYLGGDYKVQVHF